MRWPTYFILAYVALGLQIGLGGHVPFRGAGPNLLLLVVVFIALNAPRDEALLGAFLLGGMQDLVTLQPLGLYAFCYGLVAAILASVAKMVEKGHPLTQFAAALLGGGVTAVLLLAQSRWRPIAPALVDAGLPAVRLSPRVQGVVVLYTALLAPLLLGILQRMQRLFDFAHTRRPMRIG